MQVKVLKTTKAASCPLGINSKEYVAGTITEIFDGLAKVFIAEGWGEKHLVEKSLDKSPENKAFDKVIQKKASPRKKGKGKISTINK